MTDRNVIVSGVVLPAGVSAGLPLFFSFLLANRETVVQKGAADG